MAKKVSVTIAEQAALEHFAERAEAQGWEGKHVRCLRGLLLKLNAPERTRKGLGLADAQLALGGCRKYAPFVGGNRWALESRLRSQNVHQGELEAVGAWVDRQPWLTEVTMPTILNNWTNWLARAAAMYHRDGVMMPVWSVSAETEWGARDAAPAEADEAAGGTDNTDGPAQELDGTRD